MKKMKVLLFTFVFIITGSLVLAIQPQCLATGDYFKLMKDSIVSYNIKVTEGNLPLVQEKFVGYLYQQKEDHVKYPRITNEKNGNKTIVEFSFKLKAKEFLKIADKLKNNKEFIKAINSYKKALEIDSDIYPALMGMGDCYIKLGDTEKAVINYKQAVEKNQDDYYCHYKLGNGFYKAGKIKKAINSYINSLVLSPNNVETIKDLKSMEKKGYLILPDISLEPKAYISQEGKEVNIYYSKDSDQGIWYPYAITKSVWMFEPGYKDAGNGVKWFLDPEKCALENTLFYYFNQKNVKKLLPMPKIDRLVEIQDSQLLGDYLYYEAASKVYPDIMLVQDYAFKNKMKSFISRFVVLKR